MIEYPIKPCQMCGENYQSTGRCSKYCPNCREINTREQSRVNQQYYRMLAGKQVGVGKGGANLKGAADNQYKTGIKFFKNQSKILKLTIGKCQRCNKDLKEAKMGYWCVHHKDHNRVNNTIDNFELLCKRCHQLEHECWNNLPNEGATTIPTGSRE